MVTRGSYGILPNGKEHMTNGNLVTFTVGQGFTSDGKPITDVWRRRTLAKTEIATTFGGFSLSYVDGGWIDGEGKYIAEQSAKFEVVIPNDKLPFVQSMAVYLRLAFEQSSVLVTVTPAQYEFVESGEVSSVRA